MATLKDISQHLGISVTQVSRALNNHDDVSEDTKARVQAAAVELSYVPNMSARKLVMGQSGVVALVHKNNPDLVEDYKFIDSMTNLSIEFSKLGKQLVLHIAPEDADESEVYDRLISGGALDGFVVQEPLVHDPRVEQLIKREVPFVLHGRTMGAHDYPYFDIDNFKVGYLLTRHLLENGHRRIGLINGPGGLTYTARREEGYRAALAEFGVAFDDRLLKAGRMTEELGLIKTIEFHMLGDDMPTGIVAPHVHIAKGIYQAASALKLSVPQDISVVSHDDVIPKTRASAFYPALSVTRSALSDAWVPLAQFLTRYLAGEPAQELQMMCDFEFISRASVRDMR